MKEKGVAMSSSEVYDEAIELRNLKFSYSPLMNSKHFCSFLLFNSPALGMRASWLISLTRRALFIF